MTYKQPLEMRLPDNRISYPQSILEAERDLNQNSKAFILMRSISFMDSGLSKNEIKIEFQADI